MTALPPSSRRVCGIVKQFAPLPRYNVMTAPEAQIAVNMLISRLIRPVTAVVCFLLLSRMASAAPDTAGLKAEIVAMPLGTNIEVRLKNKRKVRGARGAVSDAGFVVVDSRSGERQITFDDVASVKQVKAKSHAGLYILIGLGIGAAAVAIAVAVLLSGGGY